MATINDVARRAGVSPVTVSRVINNTGSVSAATRYRVEEAIEELGYVPSGLARSLRSRRTRTLALILPDVSNAFWTTMARGVEDVAQKRGHSVFLCNTDESLSKQSHYLRVVIGQRVDGVIIAPADSDAKQLDQLRRRNIPTVVVDRRLTGWNLDTVIGDSISGAKALVELLINLGHRRIAVISGPDNTSTAVDRVAGYYLALVEAGIPVDERLIRFGEFRIGSGQLLAEEILESGAAPTAFFAANNLIAIGIIDALKRHDLQIPDQVALVCFDDLPNTAHLFPFLTVAVQPVYQMGSNAAEILLSRLVDQDDSPPRHVVLPSHLIIRQSCGSHLSTGADASVSLPMGTQPRTTRATVPGVRGQDLRRALMALGRLNLYAGNIHRGTTRAEQSDVGRLLAALRHETVDRVPLVALQPLNDSLVHAVLSGVAPDGSDATTPEQQGEFAQRVGMDAISCDFMWRPVLPGASEAQPRLRIWPDPDSLNPPPLLAKQLTRLERYVQAAEGTGVGIIARFSSFVDPVFQVAGDLIGEDEAQLTELMDVFLVHQQMVVRAVCERYAAKLAMVVIVDNLADQVDPRLDPAHWESLVMRRLQQLIAPALEHGKPVVLSSPGAIDHWLPSLHATGICAIHVADGQVHDHGSFQAEWAGRLALLDTVPSSLLARSDLAEAEAWVRRICQDPSINKGYMLALPMAADPRPNPRTFMTVLEMIQNQCFLHELMPRPALQG